MHSFVRNLITEWRRLELPMSGKTVVVGVSGGADSVSLLLGLVELKQAGKLDLRIVAAHFNHGLRSTESDADQQFVRELTTGHKIELAVGRAGKLGTGNLEQNARTARYEFMTATAANVDAFAILTGHTVNDQAETFLMNLIRGSGPQGLGGMKSVRSMDLDVRAEKGRRGNAVATEIGDGDQEKIDQIETASDLSLAPPLPFSSSPLLLVRPLLSWAKRPDTEGYCRAKGVEYRYDTMNEDTAFKRVRIRKILLPLLEDFNPRIIETLADTASLMQQMQESLPNENQRPIAGELILADIRTLPTAELYDLIRSWLKGHRGTTRQLQLKHIQAIERLISSEKSGRIAELPGGKVIKTAGKLRYKEN